MGISEKKMKIVINNYFKEECDTDTSIREAFEKGFRIGIEKGRSMKPEPRKKGKWKLCTDEIFDIDYYKCSECGYEPYRKMDISNFCPNCGADMREDT